MLYCYGENSFTFLLFNELQRTSGIVRPLIGNLKQFSSEQTFAKKKRGVLTELDSAGGPDIWLFPNFGKGSGFGEPDAIVLCGGYSFWFEVETNFDLKKRRRSAESSLTQLFRFYYFAQALKDGKTRRSKGQSHWAITGPTINGKGAVKEAVLRLAGHAMLSDKTALRKLTESVVNGRDHYVIFSEKKMIGVSQTALNSLFKQMAGEYQGLLREWAGDQNVPDKPSSDRFWYQYFQGDLRRRVEIDNENSTYVQISTG